MSGVLKLTRGPFTILVLGMQNNGKSTLLNAMPCDKVLPARASQSTGVITLLDYGDSDIVEVYEFGMSEPRWLKREEFFEQYTLKENDIFEEVRFQNVQYARMETKHRFCDHEVRLVDSPGLSKQLSQQPEITQSFLEEAHAIVLILYAKRLLEKEERYFLNHISQNHLEHVFFVINYINEIEDEVDKLQLYERARIILSKYFCDSYGNFDESLYNKRVFWINALGALKARLSSAPDEIAFKNSGMKELEEQLEALLTKIIALR